VGDTTVQRMARQRAIEIRRSVGDSLRRMREDAGLSQSAIAYAAGIDRSYLRLIEAGERSATDEVRAAVATVLGADLSVRLFPNSGPLLHDRWQAPMEEAFIDGLHPRWIPSPEVVVLRPARGVIDLVLGEQDEALLVASELNSQVRRLEQQIRWHREKELSLPSSELWRFASVDANPSTSRLLVLRSTKALRDLASSYEATLRAAYPARTADVLESLTGTAPWPGPGIVWMWVEGRSATLMDGPPRGVHLGR
jgi:transcriptional regulator with XRE-family HTH domain